MKSLIEYLQTGSNVNIYESADVLKKLNYAIKSGEPFILTGGYKETHEAVLKAAKSNNYMFYTIYVDKMTEDDLKPIIVDGQKILPDWAAHIIDNDSKSLVVFLFTDGKDHSSLFNALMPVFLENNLFGTKCSHFIPCIVSTQDLELPKPIASKLTSITI